MIYLDHAANSPVDKEVLDLFYDVTNKYYANPNSSHKLGLEAKQLLDEATINIANLLNVLPEEIIYTSGASESNNLAIKGICERYKNKGKHIITTSLEHTSIIAPISVMQEKGFEVDIVGINQNGQVDLEELIKIIREDTILVSIVSVDSEIGIKQPIEEIGKILKKYPNCFFHTDASQAIGKVRIDFTDVDLITITPHKFNGLNGFGALIKKKNVSLIPIIHGGKSTTIYRSGTPVLANVVALSKALELAIKNLDAHMKHVIKLNDILRDKLRRYKDVSINSPITAIPSTLNISIKGITSLAFMNELQKDDVYVSTKAACCPNNTPSRSVYALSKSKTKAVSSIRISLSYLTTKKEIDGFLNIFDECYKRMMKQ